MRRIALLAACLLPLLGAHPAKAYNKASAVNVFTHEILTCVSYYTLMAAEFRKSGENMDAYKYFVTASALLKKAKTMVRINRLQEKLNLITSRMEARMGDGQGGANGLYLREYGATCRKMAASPEARLKYWLDKR